MGDSWLYNELGRGAVVGSKNTLAVMSTKEGLAAALSGDFLSRLNPNTVYLTFAVPAEKVDMPLVALDMEWIDATGANHSPSPGFSVSYFESAKHLVQLSSVIGAMASGGNHSFLIVNSLNEIIDANGEEKAAEFMSFLASRLKSSGMGGLFFILADAKTARFIKTISPLFDDVMKL